MAGELTLSVVLRTLFGVRVEDDAVSGAGDNFLVVGVRHELRTEDVRSMTRADGLLNLLVVRVCDDQKGVIRPRQDIFPRVVPGYRVDAAIVDVECRF